MFGGDAFVCSALRFCRSVISFWWGLNLSRAGAHLLYIKHPPQCQRYFYTVRQLKKAFICVKICFMSNKHNSDKKYKFAAITTCGLLTALCVCYLIILIISFIRHINAPIIDKQSIVYFILGSYKIGISIVFRCCLF